MRTLFVLVSTLVLITIINAQLPDQNILQNPCVSKSTCRECIETKSCAWCMQPTDDYGDKPRCFQPSLTSLTQTCPEEYTWNPDNEQRIVINRQLTRAGSSASASGGGGYVSGGTYEEGSYGSSSWQGSYNEEHGAREAGSASGYARGQITQIAPQRIGLKLRISKLKDFNTILPSKSAFRRLFRAKSI